MDVKNISYKSVYGCAMFPKLMSECQKLICKMQNCMEFNLTTNNVHLITSNKENYFFSLKTLNYSEPN